MTVTLKWDDQFVGCGSMLEGLPDGFGSWKKDKQDKLIKQMFKKHFGVDYSPETCSYEYEVECEDAVFNMGFGEYATLPMAWYNVNDYYPENVLIDDNNKDIKVLKVLVAIYNTRNHQYTIRSQTRMKDKYYGCKDVWDWGKFTGGEITHWMPLPMYPGFEVEKDED